MKMLLFGTESNKGKLENSGLSEAFVCLNAKAGLQPKQTVTGTAIKWIFKTPKRNKVFFFFFKLTWEFLLFAKFSNR